MAPRAPLMTLTSLPSDNKPDFNVDLPYGAGNDSDAAAGYVLRIAYSSDNWATSTDYLVYTLVSADITADAVNATALGSVANGTYVARGRLENSFGVSAWTADIPMTITVGGGGPVPTYLGSIMSDAGVNTISGNVNGTASTTDLVVVAANARGTESAADQTCTFNGVALTPIFVSIATNWPIIFFAGVVPVNAGAGSNAVVVTWDNQLFQAKHFAAYQISGLTSTALKNSIVKDGGALPSSQPINIGLNDVMIATGRVQFGDGTVSFATSSQAPDSEYVDPTYLSMIDAVWHNLSPNSSFQVTLSNNASTNNTWAAVTFR